jgi:membrane protease YdiL (CAAX protease family)
VLWITLACAVVAPILIAAAWRISGDEVSLATVKSQASLLTVLVTVVYAYRISRTRLLVHSVTDWAKAIGLRVTDEGSASSVVAWTVLLSALGRWGDRALLAIDGLLPPQFSETQFGLLIKPEPSQLGAVITLCVLLGPIWEELVLRYLLYSSIRHRLGPYMACTATALIFALFHVGSLPLTLGTLIWTGLILAWGLESSRSLLPCLGCHMILNVMAVVG